MSHETSQETTATAGQTDPPSYDLSLLEIAFGPIVPREFDDAPNYTKADLWEWLLRVPNLTDDELYHAARSAIVDDAMVQRFRNMNFNHLYCRSTACFAEAKRRLKLEGHAEYCRASGIYGRAHADVMIAHGYTPTSPYRPCTCGARDRYREQRGETSSDAD